MALKIALVEDDSSIRAMLEYYFKSLGHEIAAFESGEDFFAASPKADLALLDVMLPGMDGLEILRRLRADPETAKLPIIMLTARQSEMDKVAGLDAGADDYITKPFGVMELQARVNAVLRRLGRTDPVLRYRDLVIDTAGRTVTRDGQPIALTFKEFELLRLLVSRRGTVLTRDEILFLRLGLRLRGGNQDRRYAHQGPASKAGRGLYHHGTLRGLQNGVNRV